MIAQFHREASREAIEAAEYYNSVREGLGDEFRRELWSGLDRVHRKPRYWRRRLK